MTAPAAAGRNLSSMRSGPRAFRSMTLRARELRRQATPAERRAWRLLRGRGLLGYKFRRQHPIRGFIVDFYCADLRLVLELEGEVHAEAGHRAADRERSAILVGLGYRVVRVRNEDLTADNLKRLVANLTRSPLPFRERGQG